MKNRNSKGRFFFFNTSKIYFLFICHQFRCSSEYGKIATSSDDFMVSLENCCLKNSRHGFCFSKCFLSNYIKLFQNGTWNFHSFSVSYSSITSKYGFYVRSESGISRKEAQLAIDLQLQFERELLHIQASSAKSCTWMISCPKQDIRMATHQMK